MGFKVVVTSFPCIERHQANHLSTQRLLFQAIEVLSDEPCLTQMRPLAQYRIVSFPEPDPPPLEISLTADAPHDLNHSFRYAQEMANGRNRSTTCQHSSHSQLARFCSPSFLALVRVLLDLRDRAGRLLVPSSMH